MKKIKAKNHLLDLIERAFKSKKYDVTAHKEGNVHDLPMIEEWATPEEFYAA